jgi:hypothetical protein
MWNGARKEVKESFSGLSLQNVLRRTANESQKNRKASQEKKKKERTFQRYTVNLRHLHHAILDNVNQTSQYLMIQIHGILLHQKCVPRSILSSARKHSFLKVNKKFQQKYLNPRYRTT